MKISDKDKKEINEILEKLSKDIQEFTESELKKVHYYNGVAHSHKEKL